MSARSRVRSTPHTLVHVCFVVLHAVRVSISCVHLMLYLVLCGTQLVYSLAACFHVVLCEHVAYEFSH